MSALGSPPSKAIDSDLLSSAMGLTPKEAPFHWQQKLLAKFLAGHIPVALDIPTGLGKTAVMAVWLVARISGANVPRRLVYVVDRRAVVDQATTVALGLRQFVEERHEIKTKLGTPDGLPISTLRGQHVDNREWLENPVFPAIIVGTVDMIGSRILFEGYGVSRKMRPYHAGLLGTDTLVVLDEAHLVPPFEKLLEQVARVDGDLRPCEVEHRKLVPGLNLLSLSATGRSDQPAFGLTDADLRPGTITHKRLTAAKRLVFEPLPESENIADALAHHAWSLSSKGTEAKKVIVFSDKRDDAVKAKEAVEKLAKGDKKQGIASTKIGTQLLVGGRRVHEREGTARWLEEHSFVAGAKSRQSCATFVFATSAGEVGIDLDADHMVCDLVTWERMVQRLGRVNRRGDGNAKIVVVKEPGPKPTKGEENALKKPESEREKKETKAVTAYQAKVEKSHALSRPFELLPKNEEGINVCPAALREIKLSTLPTPNDEAENQRRIERRAILDRATSDAPFRPALSRPLVDAWAMTSLPHHAGRPKIQPWLRGWVEDEPQTTVIWRRYLPLEHADALTLPTVIRDFFEAAPPHSSEMLEIETWRVLAWLKKRAEVVQRSIASAKKLTDGAAFPQLALSDEFAIILGSDGEPSGSAFSVSSLLSTLDDKKAKETLARRLADSTLVVDARFGGLSEDGLLEESENSAPQTLDSSNDWLSPIDGKPGIRFRVRAADQIAPATENGWRHRLRVPIERTADGEVVRWLIVEKWRNDSVTADDGASGALQTLAKHQEAMVARVRAIGQQLGLPQPYARMLEIAARLHDEGKRAENWQKAFNAPTIGGPFAKTPGPINQSLLDGYRHEFASLPVLAADTEFLALPSDELRDLAMHLVAAHHGFARPLIGIQGCPDAPPSLLEERSREVALRFVRLQRRWGPWGLAWWESLLRAADQQASRELELASETQKPLSSNG
ncbi:MAG: type I-G CRISPR-associated helicase/endonuclease Cas3g [Verrucomicrobiales bacterium]